MSLLHNKYFVTPTNIFLLVTALTTTALAQDQVDNMPKNFGNLPFTIDEVKRMDPEELKDKKEGVFATGIPQLGSDPLNGQGIGADVFIYSNGKKSDPLFEYTPYRSKYEFHTFFTNKDQKEAIFSFDIPYAFNSTWRLRFEAGYEDNPNLLYFGKTAATMNPLSYGGRTYSQYGNYADALKTIRSGTGGEPALVTDALYNSYRKREAILNMSAEKSYLDGKLRLLVGLEAAQVNITTFDGTLTTGVYNGTEQSAIAGTSRLQQDKSNGLLGVGTSFITIAQFGIIYDTRDFEPDPSEGWFIEFTDEASVKALGSDFDFNKTFLHAKYYTKVLPSYFQRMIFAARYGLEHTGNGAPFFEYQDAWSSEGSIEGLGGANTLRGYKQSRFMAPLMSFINVELRWRFWSQTLWGQHFTFNLVPFIDTGRVWNKIKDYSFKDYKTNRGIGLRVPWNQSTVLSFDFAQSSEDHQFFFTFGHIF